MSVCPRPRNPDTHTMMKCPKSILLLVYVSSFCSEPHAKRSWGKYMFLETPSHHLHVFCSLLQKGGGRLHVFWRPSKFAILPKYILSHTMSFSAPFSQLKFFYMTPKSAQCSADRHPDKHATPTFMCGKIIQGMSISFLVWTTCRIWLRIYA